MNTTERRVVSTAYHEAGHAAVAVRLGLGLKSVELTPESEEHLGVCRQHLDEAMLEALDTGEDDLCRRWIQYLLAGALAEEKAGYADCVGTGAASDNMNADDLIFKLNCFTLEDGEDARIAEAERLRQRTVEILAEPTVWAAVEAIAAELVRAGSLSGAEAEAIAAAVGLVVEQVPAVEVSTSGTWGTP